MREKDYSAADYLRELSSLLDNLPKDEKEDALNYYQEYLADAGERLPQLLKELGVIKKIEKNGLKVLGQGELTKKLDVKAAKFSQAALTAIKEAGGSFEVIG